MRQIRWAVNLNEMTSDILPEALAVVGYTLDGDMLSGEPFESLDEWGDVSDVAYELAHRVREVSRLNPEFEISIETSSIHEFDADGNEIHCNRKVYAKGAAVLALTGHAATISITDASLTG